MTFDLNFDVYVLLQVASVGLNEKTVIVSISSTVNSIVASLLTVGDELVSVNGVCDVTDMSYNVQLELVKSSPRPLLLGFVSRTLSK